MLVVRRIVRCQLSLNKHLYTSGTRCDQPKNPKSEGDEFETKKKSTTDNKPKTVSEKMNKKKLTAELNAKDYANFKSRKFPKVELYSVMNSQKEKSEAEEALKALTNEINSEVNNNISINEKLKTLVVPKPIVNAKSRNKVVNSAKSVALELGGDVKKTEKDILGYLKSMKLKSEERKLEKENAGFVNKEKETLQFSGRAKHFREKSGFFRDGRHLEGRLEERRVDNYHKKKQDYEQNWDSRRRPLQEQRIGDFNLRSNTLGIFKAAQFKDDVPKLKTWDELEELELKVAITVPPRNYFEELIQWTEEGKLWHFPIDNDQNNKGEENVHFTEHVFLEEYLEPWCPKRGPIRHFMELVLTGLAKNHYFSVEEKKEHIYWYRDYFEEKKKLLREMGILENAKVLQESAESNSKPEGSA